jgi:hypothetical protein
MVVETLARGMPRDSAAREKLLVSTTRMKTRIA